MHHIKKCIKMRLFCGISKHFVLVESRQTLFSKCYQMFPRVYLTSFFPFCRIITILAPVDPPQDFLKHLWSSCQGPLSPPRRGSVGPLRPTTPWTRWTCCLKSICQGCGPPRMKTGKKVGDVFGFFCSRSALLSWWLKSLIEFDTFYRNQLAYKLPLHEITVLSILPSPFAIK